jgi:hypothetical protein
MFTQTAKFRIGSRNPVISRTSFYYKFVENSKEVRRYFLLLPSGGFIESRLKLFRRWRSAVVEFKPG